MIKATYSNSNGNRNQVSVVRLHPFQ